MSVFASAASMPTRLPTTPAVGSGIPATGGGAGFSRPKPNKPRFFFSGAADGGVPHGSSDAAGVAGAGGAVQRSAVGAGGAFVPHWSGAAVGAHELPGGSAAAGCSGSVGAGPKIPESALRRSSKAGGVSAIGGAIHSGAGAGVSVARPHCGATSEMGTGPLSLGVIVQS